LLLLLGRLFGQCFRPLKLFAFSIYIANNTMSLMFQPLKSLR